MLGAPSSACSKWKWQWLVWQDASTIICVYTELGNTNQNSCTQNFSFSFDAESSCMFYPLEWDIWVGIEQHFSPPSWEKFGYLTGQLLMAISLESSVRERSCVSLLLASADLLSNHYLLFRMLSRPLQKVPLKRLSTLSSCPLRTMWTREYLAPGRAVSSAVQSRKCCWALSA